MESMRKKLLMFAILSFLVNSTGYHSAKAEDYSNLWSRSDMKEHMVTSYALTFTSYMIYRKKLEMTPESSALLSVATGLALGLIRDKFLFNHDHLGEYMKANAIGATASVLLTYSIQF
jgi:hypothetical protein